MASILSFCIPSSPDHVLGYIIAYEIVFVAVWAHGVWRLARFYDRQCRARRLARMKPFEFQEVPWKPVRLGSVAVTAPGFIVDDRDQIQSR